jgi:predicted nucleotidyltransferase
MTSPSGRFVLRISPALHNQAKRSAREAGLSLNELCTRAITGFVSGTIPALRAESTHEDPLIERVKKMFGSSLKGILLFGSFSRGEQRENSDVDLLVVLDNVIKLTRKLYTRWDEQEFDDRLSPHFVHEPPAIEGAGSIWLEASIDGIMLYEVDRRLSFFLRDLRHSIISGKYERKMAHGHPYWKQRSKEEPIV